MLLTLASASRLSSCGRRIAAFVESWDIPQVAGTSKAAEGCVSNAHVMAGTVFSDSRAKGLPPSLQGREICPLSRQHVSRSNKPKAKASRKKGSASATAATATAAATGATTKGSSEASPEGGKGKADRGQQKPPSGADAERERERAERVREECEQREVRPFSSSAISSALSSRHWARHPTLSSFLCALRPVCRFIFRGSLFSRAPTGFEGSLKQRI